LTGIIHTSSVEGEIHPRKAFIENTIVPGHGWFVCIGQLVHGIDITSDHDRYVLAAVHERVAEPNRK